jgi:hypothetical protein
MSNTSSSGDGCGCVVPRFDQLRGVLGDSCGDSEDGGGVAAIRPPPMLGRAPESTRDRPVRVVYCSGGSGAVECSARLDLSMDFGAPIFSLSDGDVGDGIASASASEAECSESGIRRCIDDVGCAV